MEAISYAAAGAKLASTWPKGRAGPTNVSDRVSLCLRKLALLVRPMGHASTCLTDMPCASASRHTCSARALSSMTRLMPVFSLNGKYPD